MTSDPSSISALPEADQEAIGATLNALMTGFTSRDADALRSVYTDWVNAFGSVKKGGPEIVEYLRGLFADANFNAGRMVAPPEWRLRVLTDEVVLLCVHLRVAGQGLVDGGTLDRDNFSLHVLQRQDDGGWRVVSEMFNDANTEQSYAQHS
jgi:ketosteroid isomerase-like protein